MPASRPVPALAALLAALLAVTAPACGERGGGEETTGSTAAKGDATASGIDINPVPRDQLPDGGTLRWPLIATPPNFNTGELDGTSADTANVVGALLPAMFNFDGAARASVNKDYLDTAELTDLGTARKVTAKSASPRSRLPYRADSSCGCARIFASPTRARKRRRTTSRWEWIPTSTSASSRHCAT